MPCRATIRPHKNKFRPTKYHEKRSRGAMTYQGEEPCNAYPINKTRARRNDVSKLGTRHHGELRRTFHSCHTFMKNGRKIRRWPPPVRWINSTPNLFSKSSRWRRTVECETPIASAAAPIETHPALRSYRYSFTVQLLGSKNLISINGLRPPSESRRNRSMAPFGTHHLAILRAASRPARPNLAASPLFEPLSPVARLSLCIR